MLLKFCQKVLQSISDSYSKFGTAAQRRTGVITWRKKWGRPPLPASRGLVNVDFLDILIDRYVPESSNEQWRKQR